MKKIKRIVLLVVAVLVLLVAASGVKTVLDMKNSADNEVQEEDSTRWAEPTSDPLNIEGIADASAKYASAAVNGSLNLVFNGIWSRQTDYFTVPGGSLTITGYGTAEGTQRYKVSVWQKVAGGAQYVNGSTYYIKTDGQNYRCVISGLDPAASYRLTISYDSSRYYLYGGLKVEGRMKTQTRHSLMLMLCAFIWGTAFVAQSAGSGMGAYSFLAGRSWLAVLVLIPTVFAFDAVRKKQGQPYGWPKEKSERKTLLAAGLVCGTFLFAASAAQQIGITINPSTAKAAFLTAMYVVLVPVFGLFLGRKGSAQLWVSMVIAVAGLYMLCMKNGFGGIETSDWILLSCAVLFSFQIMSIDHFSPLVDGVRLSLIQFIVVAVESSAAALIFETPTLAEYGANFLPVVYCGVMSSGAGYTLQILGQKELNPAIASLIMCLESVFSALGGWLLLGQNLSMRESAGCALIFAAVLLSQLPLAELHRCKKSA